MPDGTPYDHKKIGRIYIQQQMSDLWVGVKEDGTPISVHPYLCRPVNQAEVVKLDEVREQIAQKESARVRQVAINHCSPAELARAVKGGIGPTRAAKILSRKPGGGYMSYTELEQVNSDLGINWSAIALDDPISFEIE